MIVAWLKQGRSVTYFRCNNVIAGVDNVSTIYAGKRFENTLSSQNVRSRYIRVSVENFFYCLFLVIF